MADAPKSWRDVQTTSIMLPPEDACVRQAALHHGVGDPGAKLSMSDERAAADDYAIFVIEPGA